MDAAMGQAERRVVSIASAAGGTAAATPAVKIIDANQKAVDALPLNSGTWRIRGVPGLYVRCRLTVKTYVLQRRVRGVLVKRTLGQLTLREARAAAMREWHALKPPPSGGRKTLEQAFREFLTERELAPATRKLYQYNAARYLAAWLPRALQDVGADRAGVRALFHDLARTYGKATASQTVRMLSAVYRYARRVDHDLPESPTVVVDLPAIKPRDWAYAPDDLREWWAAVQKLGAVKRAWWLTALLTGARRGSVEALKWEDVDTERRTIRFSVAKGGRAYLVPAADKLLALLAAYRDSGEAPPSEWVFPSAAKTDAHLVNVRDEKRGVMGAHHLRHTFRTTLAALGATPDQARLLMGHSLSGDVSRGYITAPLLVESLRALVNAVAARYGEVLGW
jgi:integrase